MTSILQPLHVAVNKPFKDRLRHHWTEWMLNGEKETTKGRGANQEGGLANNLPVDRRGLEGEAKSLVMDYANIEKYETAEVIMIYSLVHRVSLPAFMSRATFQTLSCQPTRLTLQDVTDCDFRGIIQKIADGDSWDVSMIDFITQSGCRNLMLRAKREELIKSLVTFHSVDRHKEACERLRERLKTLGVLDSIMEQPRSWKQALCYSAEEKLTAAKLEKLSHASLSQHGSNRRREENHIQAYWREFLLQLEDDVLLGELLNFCTRMSSIPVLGFVERAELSFRYPASVADVRSATKEFPVASTCALRLELPILPSTAIFSERMMAAIWSPLLFLLE